MTKQYSIGILGTARINRNVLFKQIENIPEFYIRGIASRKKFKAFKYSKIHKIKKSYGSYQALLDDPSIDIIYNPLPNKLHCEWSIKALKAGKHVLCEKPIAANAEDAKMMKKAQEDSGLILMNAQHSMHSPFSFKLQELVKNKEIGEIKSIYVSFCFNHRNFQDHRWNYSLGGGSLMDVGCYCISMINQVMDSNPQVTSAEAEIKFENIDAFTHAEFKYPNGTKGIIECGMSDKHKKGRNFEMIGTNGTITSSDPWNFSGGTIKIKKNDSSEIKSINMKGKKTYQIQLEALRDAIIHGKPFITDIDNGILTMEIIDEIYQKVGLKPRST